MLDTTAALRRGAQLLSQALLAAQAYVDLRHDDRVAAFAQRCNALQLQRLLDVGTASPIVTAGSCGVEGAFPDIDATIGVLRRDLDAVIEAAGLAAALGTQSSTSSSTSSSASSPRTPRTPRTMLGGAVTPEVHAWLPRRCHNDRLCPPSHTTLVNACAARRTARRAQWWTRCVPTLRS